MPLVTRTGQVSFAPKGDKGDKGARMRMRVWGASVSYLEGKQGQPVSYTHLDVYKRQTIQC